MIYKYRFIYCACVAIVTGIFMSAPVLAQLTPGTVATTPCLDMPRDKPGAIRKLYSCADTTEAYELFNKKLDAAQALQTQAERLNLIAAANQELARRLEDVSANFESDPGRQFASSFFTEIEDLAVFLETPSMLSAVEANKLVRNQRWALRNNQADGHLFKAYSATLTLCDRNSVSESCLVAIREVSDLAVLARLAERLNAVYRDKAYDSAIEQEENIIARMNSVDSITPFQYPWELALNRKWLDCGIGDKNTAKFEGTSGILTSLPDCRWIWFHPDVAFGYSPDSIEGAKSTEALVLELAGFMKYRFNQSKAENAWGVSLAATFADLAGSGNDMGFGLTLRYGKFGFTVSRHDDETLYLLNLELFDSFGKRKVAYDEFVQKR